MPSAASGDGLPSPLINCLLVSSNNTVYAGTDGGLAASRDGGLTWRYQRGADWKDKLAGLYHPITPSAAPFTGDLLSEDYVTSLAEGTDGRLFIGHRQTGVEAFDPKTGKRVQSGANGIKTDDYVGCLLTAGTNAWVGLYGGGLHPPIDAAPAETAVASSVSLPPLPLPAKPPTLAELNVMLAKVRSLTGEMPVGGGAYLGEDWRTQGDWVGRYGSRYAVLCACGAPLDNFVLSDFSYKVSGFIGPHHESRDGLRTYCTWVHTDDPRVLWDPIPGYRREAEWDDHAEVYPQSFDGPDVWAKVSVPAGLHRLSLYFMNKDGHDGLNRVRDYRVELKAEPADMPQDKWISAAEAANPDAMPTLTAARVHDFWYGVYERFLVRGPAVYMVKVGKNGSFNTILQSVMLDKVSGPPTEWEKRRSVWYGKDAYQPPISFQVTKLSARLAAAQSLWDTLDQSTDQQGIEALSPRFRLLAYRALLADPKEVADPNAQTLAANWRWQLCLWDSADRTVFQQAMTANWQSLAAVNPKLALGNQ